MVADDRVCAAHSGLIALVHESKAQTVELWIAVKAIQNRPPVWATALMSFLTFVVGILVGIIGMGVK